MSAPYKRQFSSINMVRGLASFYVFLYHLNGQVRFSIEWLAKISEWGWLGVTAFFVVSGFCMGLIENGIKPKEFMVSRLLRIYPPYFASIVLTCFIVGILFFFTGVNEAVELPDDLRSILSMMTLIGKPLSDVEHINWVYWTLVVEMCFYYCFCFYLVCKDRGLGSLPLILPLFFLFLLESDFFGYNFFAFTKYYVFFLIGYYGFVWSEKRNNLALIAIFSLVSLSLINSYKVESLTGLAAIFFILACNFSVAQVVFDFLSKISYSLYLIHVPFACYLMLGLRERFQDSSWEARFFVDFFVISITLIFAYIFYIIVEKPSHDLAKSAVKVS